MTLPVLPPGTILQLMYLKERLKKLQTGYFLEVGCGTGIVSHVLLQRLWSGIGIDLNPDAIAIASQINRKYIEQGRYSASVQDYFTLEMKDYPVDLIISCMVIEHLSDEKECLYFEKARDILKASGKLITIVPACPYYWGIEDEIAGHYRRYTRKNIASKLIMWGYQIDNIVGLTYPLSNWLYPISELLVGTSESHLTTKPIQERTRLSGARNVKFKTTFPNFMKIFLNDITMYPFHILQKLNCNNDYRMVLYAEATKL